MRIVILLLGALASACTTTRVLQRDGCFVRRTERAGSASEEIGPCARPPPQWSQDRATRLAQECMAAEESRWMSRAVVAWGRSEPLPPRATDAEVMKACVLEPARLADQGEAEKARAEAERERARLEREAAEASLRAESAALQARLDSQGEALRERLADLAADRDALRERSDDDRRHINDAAERLATFLGDTATRSAESLGDAARSASESLGEAARKPATPAFAYAASSSDSQGRSGTEHTSTATRDEGPAQPLVPAALLGLAAPACAAPLASCAAPPATPRPSPAVAAPRPGTARAPARLARRPARTARAGCEPGAQPGNGPLPRKAEPPRTAPVTAQAKAPGAAAPAAGSEERTPSAAGAPAPGAAAR